MSRTHHLIDTESDWLWIVPWHDPIVERLGHPAIGDYVETFWLGTLGPSATWLLRRFAAALAEHPDGCAVDLPATAAALGLGWERGRANPFARAIERLAMFGLAQPSSGSLAVRCTVPPVPFKQIARLPEHLQLEHQEWLLGRRSGGVSVAVFSDATAG